MHNKSNCDNTCFSDCQKFYNTCCTTGARGPQGLMGPQGLVGATGPTGTTGTQLQTFGGIYGVSLEDITLLPFQEVILPLTSQFPSSNVTYGTKSITIEEAGVYEVSFNSMTYTKLIDAPFVLSVYIRLNGIRRFPFSTVFPVTNSMKQFGYNGFATLTQGDILEVAMETIDGGQVSFGYDISSELTVRK